MFPIHDLKEVDAFDSASLLSALPLRKLGLENVDSGYLVRADFGC